MDPVLDARLQRADQAADHRHRDRLDRHLTALKREGAIETWHDQRIAPGTDWRVTLDEKLREADVILLLISADFLASDFCVDVEMMHAIDRHRQGTAHVIPIPVRSADWGTMPFAVLAPLPRSRMPIALSEDQEAAWKEVADGIRQVVASMVWSPRQLTRARRGTRRAGRAAEKGRRMSRR